ncbi:Wadjet anti-phage system protein JetD domain-containing protein [Rhodococcus koreensis]
MRTPEQIADRIASRLDNTWAESLTTAKELNWPHTWTLLARNTTNRAVASQVRELAALTQQWRAVAAQHPGITTIDHTWNAHGTQTLTQQVVIDDIDAAAAIADSRNCRLSTWPTLLHVARTRLPELAAINPTLDNIRLARLLRTVILYSDHDFRLLCDTARWFITHGEDASGLTPRQVPIPGVHAKWLNARQREVATLSGCTDGLGLLPNHAPRIHFTYLDPAYRRSGGRVHDSHTLGDTIHLAYQPELIIVSENKDTAILFPPTPGAIAVEGNGNEGPSRLSQFGWITHCPNIIYWGDIDAAGFKIVNDYRDTLPIRTILMDHPTYTHYAAFGTNHYPDGSPVPTGGPNLPNLAPAEALAYSTVTAVDSDPRRVEQERIPLHAATQAITELLATRPPHPLHPPPQTPAPAPAPEHPAATTRSPR